MFFLEECYNEPNIFLRPVRRGDFEAYLIEEDLCGYLLVVDVYDIYYNGGCIEELSLGLPHFI
jgi:hypothetical protein